MFSKYKNHVPFQKNYLFWVAAIILFPTITGTVTFLESLLAPKINFAIREKLDQATPLSKKIKVIAFDDFSLESMQKPGLSLKQWSHFLGVLGQYNPGMILIDKVFSVSNIGDVVTDLKRFPSNQDIKIYSAGYSVATGQLTKLAKKSDSQLLRRSLLKIQCPTSLWPCSSKTRGIVAAHNGLEHYFSKFGHIELADSGNIDPFIKVANNQFIPHLSLQVLNNLNTSEDSKLLVDNKIIPLTTSKQMMIDFISNQEISTKIMSFKWVLDQLQLETENFKINKGDIVIILPNYFTGSTDFKKTPIGDIPGGIVLTSMINSAIQKSWLTPLFSADYIYILALVLGIFISLSSLTFVPSLVLVSTSSIGMIVVGIILFSYHSIVVPWVSATLGLVIGFILISFIKMKRHEQQATLLKNAFEGFVSKKKLQTILQSNPHSFTSNEQLISIMFIDVVKFSKSTDGSNPKQVFETIKSILDLCRSVILKYDGHVDKSLGDGILCYFGMNLSGQNQTSNHADIALKCAIEIQERMMQRNCGEISPQNPNPLRIGINTGNVYIGDLGSANRIEITAIGRAVNTAQRMETACDPYKILISSTTKELLVDSIDFKIYSRYILIKHVEDLTLTYEIDPFFDQKKQYQLAMVRHFESLNISRQEVQRIDLSEKNIEYSSNYCTGKLLDISHGGLSISSNKFLGREVAFNLTIQLLVQGEIKKLNLAIKVRNGTPIEDGFQMGCAFVGLNMKEREEIFQQLTTLE